MEDSFDWLLEDNPELEDNSKFVKDNPVKEICDLKVGNTVRIKSIEWYNENKNSNGFVESVPCLFVPDMAKYCGKIYKIADITSKGYYRLDKVDRWVFSKEMFDLD